MYISWSCFCWYGKHIYVECCDVFIISCIFRNKSTGIVSQTGKLFFKFDIYKQKVHTFIYVKIYFTVWNRILIKQKTERSFSSQTVYNYQP